MKHRSVIAFVIVAAALFAAPQLSHDLQALKGSLGARLRGEILHALLSSPATEGTSAHAPRRSESLLASCREGKTGVPAAKTRKGQAAAPQRAESRAAEAAGEQLASAAVPAPEVRVELAEGVRGPAFAEADGSAHGTRTLTEVAMIIPPDSGIEPRSLLRLSEQAAREGARQTRKLAQETRMAYVAAGVAGKQTEWRKANETLRTLDELLPGGFEFHIERGASVTKVLKVKRGVCCPAPAPRAPRVPGQVAVRAPLPVAGEPDPSDGE